MLGAVQSSAMPHRDDARLGASSAEALLEDVHLYRCERCGIARAEADHLFRTSRHARCGGFWLAVVQPLARAVLLAFLTREAFAGVGRRRGPEG